LTDLPEKWKPKYIIKRIDEQPIEISLGARDAILAELKKDARFILVKDHVLMLNSIKSIDPLWKNNIPPKPKPLFMYNGAKVDYPMSEEAENQVELDEWEKYFGEILTGSDIKATIDNT